MKESNLKVIAIVIITITFVIFYGVLRTTITPNVTAEHSSPIIEKDNPQIGGSFTLTDSHGGSFNSKQLEGKASIIYFGFTYCPDVCVVSLQKINQVLNTLDQYKIDINSVFITIDPKRDTAPMLESYFKNFHPKFIALTGTQEQINNVANKYKVYHSVRGDFNSNDYLIDHSTFIYIFDKDGNYMTHFNMDSKIEEIVEYIRVNCR
ncbi:MAG: sco2 [Rickettsiaceae bacterium]|jgi:protein SCO1/2|nr:sco2 [Rickettsiaceae bacterium]